MAEELWPESGYSARGYEVFPPKHGSIFGGSTYTKHSSIVGYRCYCSYPHVTLELVSYFQVGRDFGRAFEPQHLGYLASLAQNVVLRSRLSASTGRNEELHCKR